MSCTAPCRSVEILGEEAFTDRSAEWNALLAASYDNRLFLTSDWNRIWWQHFGSDHPLIFTQRCDDGRLEAILPLQLDRTAGEKTLTLLGDYNVADYMDAIAQRGSSRELLKHLWSCVIEELHPERILLRHVPSGSDLIRALEDLAADRSLQFTVEQDEVAPVAILCSTWDGYLQTLTKKQRHEIRRKLRRAEEGVESSWLTARTHEELDEFLPTFFRLHELSGREKARFMTPNMREFFLTLAHYMLERNELRLSIFRREGADIATTMSFVYADRYLLYNSGYDPEYAAHSPGIAAVAHAMQDAITEEASAFDFLSGDEPYKYQMGAQNTYTCRVELSL